MGSLGLIGALAIVLAGFMAYVLIATRARYWVKWALIPIVVGAGLWLFLLLPSILGTPYMSTPTKDFVLLGIREFSSDQSHKWIEIWVIERGSSSSRLYLLPYSDKLDATLKDLLGRGRPGMAGAYGHFRGSPSGQGGTDNWGLDVHEFPQSTLPAKTAIRYGADI